RIPHRAMEKQRCVLADTDPLVPTAIHTREPRSDSTQWIEVLPPPRSLRKTRQEPVASLQAASRMLRRVLECSFVSESPRQTALDLRALRQRLAGYERHAESRGFAPGGL